MSLQIQGSTLLEALRQAPEVTGRVYQFNVGLYDGFGVPRHILKQIAKEFQKETLTLDMTKTEPVDKYRDTEATVRFAWDSGHIDLVATHDFATSIPLPLMLEGDTLILNPNAEYPEWVKNWSKDKPVKRPTLPRELREYRNARMAYLAVKQEAWRTAQDLVIDPAVRTQAQENEKQYTAFMTQARAFLNPDGRMRFAEEPPTWWPETLRPLYDANRKDMSYQKQAGTWRETQGDRDKDRALRSVRYAVEDWAEDHFNHCDHCTGWVGRPCCLLHSQQKAETACAEYHRAQREIDALLTQRKLALLRMKVDRVKEARRVQRVRST